MANCVGRAPPAIRAIGLLLYTGSPMQFPSHPHCKSDTTRSFKSQGGRDQCTPRLECGRKYHCQYCTRETQRRGVYGANIRYFSRRRVALTGISRDRWAACHFGDQAWRIPSDWDSSKPVTRRHHHLANRGRRAHIVFRRAAAVAASEIVCA